MRLLIARGGLACIWLSVTAHAAPLSSVEVYAKAAPSVWRVQTYDADGVPLGQGSGVVTGADTLITNCHVLAKAKRVSVQRESSRLDARLDMWDTERDVCQLRVAGLVAPAVTMVPSGRLLVGQPVYAIGNPMGLDLTMSSGLVSSLRRDDSGHIILIQTSAAISGGSSGGGLFDDEGRLIGLTTLGSVTGRAQNLNFAVPTDWVLELPQRHAKLNPGATTLAARTSPPTPSEASPSAARKAASALPDPRGGVPGLDGDLRRGDEFEYTITDGYTGNARRVVYRVDRVDDEKVVFNSGARTEAKSGELIEMPSPIGGDMDTMAPPQGWFAADLVPGATWQLKFTGRNPAYALTYALKAQVQEATTLRTAAGEFEVVPVSFKGWSQLVSGAQQQVTLQVWIAPALRRVVRFTSDARNSSASIYSYLISKEQAELTAIRRP